MEKLVLAKPIRTYRLWIMSIVFFVAHQSYAIGFGDIQVNSYLGEPLSAQVDLTELAKDYESTLKLRLASPDEYKKNGFNYPYDIKFRFSLVNETGKQPSVRISTLKPIDEPFLNLLLEVSSPTGKVVKTFTFLIDPSPDIYNAQTYVQGAANTLISVPDAVLVPTSTPAKTSSSVNQTPHSEHVVSHQTSTKTVPKRGHKSATRLNGGHVLSNKLSLSLSTSLSISNNDPAAKDSNDALQEELIAKEKTLKDLNNQIAAMHTLIQGLQGKLTLTTASDVSASGVLAQSGIINVQSAISQPAPVVATKIVAPIAQEKDVLTQVVSVLREHTEELLAGVSALILCLLAFYWYRKKKLEQGWIPNGLFDDVEHAPQAESIIKNAPVAEVPIVTKKLDIGSQAIKVPVVKEQQKAQSTLPAEYDLLEEADIYLRFGHDKLAEEVLRDALKINPTNPEIYMTLLGIFDTRSDAKGYEVTAKELKIFADQATWNKVVEVGRRLDMNNSLYD